ncbi:MAG: GNAT family N-acetyltransferase [Pseudonocardia sp.]|nr:GNAT family N-acetyltransferase [Pseudonocardia sp.]
MGDEAAPRSRFGHSTRPPGGSAGWPDGPIFHQPWWLDAVAPRRWDAVTVDRGGRTVAALPFVVRGPRWWRVLTQPPLTPFLGPWIAQEEGAKYGTSLGNQMELQAQLENGLPAAAAFHQNFSSRVINCLPFIWAGYRAEVRYTYLLENLGSEQALWEGLAGNIRREIRKARRQLVIRDAGDVDRFYRVWAKTFERQGAAAPDRARLERIDAACAKRGSRTMLFACDEADRVHAVAYVVWDRRSAYYLMGGGDPQLRTSGASSLLVWEAISRARSASQVFDFEGSMLRPVERFFRAFGGRQTPYLHVSRATRAGGAALAVRACARRWLRR